MFRPGFLFHTDVVGFSLDTTRQVCPSDAIPLLTDPFLEQKKRSTTEAPRSPKVHAGHKFLPQMASVLIFGVWRRDKTKKLVFCSRTLDIVLEKTLRGVAER